MQVCLPLQEEKVISQAAALYQEVWQTKGDITSRMRKHQGYPGFIGYIMMENEAVIGLAYGYQSKEGQYYRELIQQELQPEERDFWLRDCFEVVEVLVAPGYRRKRVGAKLINRLIQETACSTSILTASKQNKAGVAFYQQQGWLAINDTFLPGIDGEPYFIFAKKLD